MANNIILPFSELQAELNDEAMIDPNAIIEITENGRYNVARYGYADVDVPQPSGKITITENGTDIDVSEYATADVNVEGGGGSSDFSTAEMTLDAGSGVMSGIAINIIYVDVELDTLYFNTLESLPSGTYIVPLYHGNAIAFIDPENNYTVSGNATVDEAGNMAITGDFTVSKP